MRPLELTVEGFRSYRGRATFDWRKRRLVGIVGPIGAGKSSILDAVSFALYGKTPLVERDTKSLIHQLCDTCHVELRFSVDGQVMRAVRALRRRGQAGHSIELLAGDEPVADILETITGERAVNERVEQLLGLDFKAFCRSVLLAQNQFSEFLKATPGDRDKVLKGVFGYERLDDALRVARFRVERADLELEALAKEASGAQTARAKLPEAKERERGSRERLEALKQATPRVEACTRERAEADLAARSATSRIAELQAVAEELPSTEEVAEVSDAAARAGEVVEGARERADDAEARRKEAEATLKEIEARVGDRSRFVTFAALVTMHEQQAAAVVRERERLEAAAAVSKEAAEAAERLAIELERILADAEAAAVAADGAEAVVKKRREDLLDARHAEMAFELRGALLAGEACPVCSQPVHTLPKKATAPKVQTAERNLEKAEAAEARVRGKRDAVAAKVAAATTAVELARRSIADAGRTHVKAEEDVRNAATALAATKSELVDRLGEGDPRELLSEREAELAAAEAARDEAAQSAEQARGELDRSKTEAATVAERLARVANRLAGVWGRLGEAREVTAAPEEVRGTFEAAAATIVTRHEEAGSMLTAAEERAGAADEELIRALTDVGLDPGADFAQEVTSAAVDHANLERDAVDLERTIKAAGRIDERIEEAEARRALAERLAKDLQPSRFLAFLLEEERAELAELGSEHFEQLTGGGYRFTADDAFNILDLNSAGTERKADSLSGGETFLASLGLALALAEMVARGGGRLDAFFLDEGFGSLDPEHLDRAMDGIGLLVAGRDDRLVVLVSHVAEMREAVEDLIVLDKDPITGDTVVVSGASPEALVP